MNGDEPLWRAAAAHTLHTSFVLKARLEELLQAHTGLLLADNEALLHLSTGRLRMSDIADRLVLTRGGVTKVIDRLEAMGHVVRRTDPDDRRATLVEITDSGRAIREAAREIIDAELRSTWAAHISDEEARVLVDVMTRVLEARDSG